MSDAYIAKNIKALRQSLGLTQHQFGERIDVSETTVWKWEHGHPIRAKNIDEIVKEFNVERHDIMGFSDGIYARKTGLTEVIKATTSNTYAPVLGNVAAGDPREAFEWERDEIWIPPDILERDSDAFYLRVSGDSMDKTPYKDGVYAAISPNAHVNNGDIAAVKVNGDEMTLKVYKYYDGVVYLEPRSTNEDYKRIIIDTTDHDAPEFRLVGKAVWPFYPITF